MQKKKKLFTGAICKILQAKKIQDPLKGILYPGLRLRCRAFSPLGRLGNCKCHLLFEGGCTPSTVGVLDAFCIATKPWRRLSALSYLVKGLHSLPGATPLLFQGNGRQGYSHKQGASYLNSTLDIYTPRPDALAMPHNRCHTRRNATKPLHCF